MIATRDNFPLLAELLAEQQRLDTPVARFAADHENGSFEREGIVRPSLLPLSAPVAGEHYAFEVDLDSCSGCKSCVAACHAMNGLDETETWRDVGLLVSPSRARPFTQTITSACHHCADPACLNGCPVLAYEKDPVTGIVRHLDDQCIGCSYCILKCPYDAPKFSARLGIVRKCDMCHGRLAAGEAPACAQACPTHAIRIVTVTTEDRKPETGNRIQRDSAADTRADLSGFRSPVSGFLPGAPDPDYTRPTTRYVTQRALPDNLAAADAGALRPQPAHWPLVIMLTLVPAAVGLAGAGALGASWLAGSAGLAASAFHLGRPLRAWRIFLGWRTSWLSREAMVFSIWIAVATAALRWPELRFASAAIGAAGLACSAFIYSDTRRHFWRASQTLPRILGVAAIVALALTAPVGAVLALSVKIAIESRTVFGRGVSARLQRGPLAPAAAARDLLAVVALVLFVAAPGGLAVAVLLAGELMERYLFFRAVDAPKMPGMPA